jgi:hypothetical protein
MFLRLWKLLITIAVVIPLSAVAYTGTPIDLPDVHALALDQLVKNRKDEPVTVIETPQILTKLGQPAQGLTEIAITLDASAPVAWMVNNKQLNPGATMIVVQDLTATSGAVKIPVYPAKTGVNGSSPYVVDIPTITAALCDAGSTLNITDDTCHQLKTYALTFTCPNSSWKQSGDLSNCLQETTIPKESCPTGYFSNKDGTCTLVETAPTVPQCSSGYTYSTTNQRCEKTLTQSAYKTCADSSYSYNSVTNKCEKTVTQAVNYDCPSGYSYNTTLKVCERTLTQAATPVCASGYSYSTINQRCEKTVTQTASKVCTTGYTYNATTNQCEKTTTTSASKVCASGYTYNSSTDKCEKTVTQTASKVCTTGYTYNASTNQCEKTTTTSASKVCASGYTYNSSTDKCEKTVTQTASKVCASGYTYSSTNDRCEKTTTTTASKVCASGYTYSSINDRCEKTTTTSATPVCASGYTYNSINKDCEKTNTTTATKVCASGYTYNSSTDQCLETVTTTPTCSSGYTYDSASNTCKTTTTTSKVCSSGGTLQSDGTCGTSYDLCANFQASINSYGANTLQSCTYKQSKTCHCYSTQTSSWTDYSIGNTQCDPFDDATGYCNVNSTASCPSGYLATAATTCSKTDSVTPSCPSGYSWSGSACTKTLTTSYTYSCPSGYTNNNNGTCSQVVTQANTYSCPSGYTLSGSTCSRLDVATYTYSCPSGYSLSGSTCSLLQTAAYSYSCPSGYSLSGSTCSQVQSTTYTYSCPSGYSLSGSTCSLLQTAAYSYSCPSGYSLSGSTCSQLQTTANTYSCPSGYTLNGSTCSLYQQTAYSLSCSDSTYTPNSSTEVCEKTLEATYIYACSNTSYTLSGSTCSLLQTQANTWVCSDPTYTKDSDLSCSKVTVQTLPGSCPTGWTREGNVCHFTDTATMVQSCAEGYTLQSNQCVKNYTVAASCANGIVDASSCTCPTGTTFNTTTLQCDGTDTQTIIKTCPAGFTNSAGTCTYSYDFPVIYDYCLPGTEDTTNNSCLLSFGISATQTCPSPYALVDGQCQYDAVVPAGQSTDQGQIGKTYDGQLITETPSIKLSKDSYYSRVEKLSEDPQLASIGCNLVSSAAQAKGKLVKGYIPCYISWTSFPNSLSANGNKIEGILKDAGTQSIGYKLRAFNGSSLTEFTAAEGTIDLDVTEPPKPVVTNVTTRMMSQVLSGFEMYNYDASSTLSMTSVIVEPREYSQLITIDNVGNCTVAASKSSCTIYSNVTYTRDDTNLQFDSNYKIWGNSSIGGWDDTELTPTDWIIHQDFRGPNVVFAQLNANPYAESVVNNDLNTPVVIDGGYGAAGILKLRDEVDNAATWWKPNKIDLTFDAGSGITSVNTLTIDDMKISFDVPNFSGTSQTISSGSPESVLNTAAYKFGLSKLTAGTYTMTVKATDAYNNTTSKVFDNVVIAPPAPQIRIFNKSVSIENATSVPTVLMLDDLLVVAHNGIVGDTKITSITIDGKEALTSNTDKSYRHITGEGFSLQPYSTYEMVVTAQDSNGQTSEKRVSFQYMNTKFGFNKTPSTVIQKVEDLDLSVYRKSGQRCDLYGTKAAAVLAANSYNHACYIEFTKLPDGLTTSVDTFQAKVSGGVVNLGSNTVGYSVYVVDEAGHSNFVTSDSVTFDTTPPVDIDFSLDQNLKIADGLYGVGIINTQLGRYNGTSSRANVEMVIAANSDSKTYTHNQLPFGDVQSFSGYADLLGTPKLWDRVTYTMTGRYKLAPELQTVKTFDVVITPHPYMQVLMTIDSQKYASTDTIPATVQLGIKNNLTGTFDYNPDTMGTGWDVFIGYKLADGTYEPITNTVATDSQGIANLSLNAQTLFDRNETIYAVAKAKSPYPDVSVTRVSVGRTLTVVKGTAVDGDVIARTTSSRIPAYFDVRFETASMSDMMVLGDIDWQKQSADGSWTSVPDFANKQYISVTSTTPETITLRAIVTNKTTGVQTTSGSVKLISYDVPSLKIDGAGSVISGQAITVNGVDENGQTDTVMQWSLDGTNWEDGTDTYTFTADGTVNKVYGRMRYASTDPSVGTGGWSQAIKYLSIISPKPLSMTITKPSMAEVNTDIDLSLSVSNVYASTGLPLRTEWDLPDGTVVTDQTAITYSVKPTDLDANKRLNIVAKAWIDGFKNETLGTSTATMSTFTYTFPTDLSLTINNNVKFVPSTAFATVNMPYLNAPGVTFTYDWSYDSSAIQVTSQSGKSLNFTVIKPGVQELTVLVSDNRGNFKYVTGFVEAIAPNPLEFSVNSVYSNNYMRELLTVSMYPNVKVGHPYDYVKTYTWTINGVTQDPSPRAVGMFENLGVGHYDVKLNVTTNFGQTGEWTTGFDVKANQIPVCKPTARKVTGVMVVDANCVDPDGVISYYRWTANGVVYSPSGSQMRFSDGDYPSANITIEAVDDAGGIGVGTISY